MNNDMKKVDIWLQANGLVINLEKTHYMVFHRARIKTNSSKISIRDNEILRVFSTKFLGIIIDDQLKWLEHIQYIKNKVSKSVGILCKVQKYLEQQTLHNLYNYERFEQIKVRFNRFRSILRESIKRAKQTYYNTTFDRFKHDIKRTWAVIDETLHRKKRESPSHIFFHNGKSLKDSQEIANAFNEYFISIGPSLANTIKGNDHYSKYLK